MVKMQTHALFVLGHLFLRKLSLNYRLSVFVYTVKFLIQAESQMEAWSVIQAGCPVQVGCPYGANL